MERKEIKYLFDSNIFLELLLEQKKRTLSAELFDKVSISEMAISNFSLDTILLILLKHGRFNIYKSFLSDLFIDSHLSIYRLSPFYFKP